MAVTHVSTARITDEQVRAYEARGYVTLPGFFADAELRAVTEYLEKNEAVTWKDKNDDPLRESHYRRRAVYDFCVQGKLLDVIEAILGPDIVLLYTHFINKRPGGRGVAWHQDGPYWPRIEPKVAVTAWTALDDSDMENGCMKVIPGSHAGCVDYGQKQTDAPDLIQDHAIALPPGVVDERKAEPVLLRRGDLSLHHSYIIHGSDPNPSQRRRAALTIRYIPASTHIQPRPDRKQYLVRGRAADNGNVYFRFGE